LTKHWPNKNGDLKQIDRKMIGGKILRVTLISVQAVFTSLWKMVQFRTFC
jgi:hypothetical protein